LQSGQLSQTSFSVAKFKVIFLLTLLPELGYLACILPNFACAAIAY
jgi:hypothetical protein